MKVHLVVAAGVHKGKMIPIPGGSLTVGRDPENNLRPASPAISKKHCQIKIHDGKVTIQDFGSTNGTEVNGEVIKSIHELNHNDLLKIGPLEFKMSIVSEKKSGGTPLPESLKKPDSESAKNLRDTLPGADDKTELAASKNENDDAAAMLLMDDDDDEDPTRVPEGSTIMELPSIMNEQLAGAAKEAKKDEKKTSEETSSSAAGDLLKKYLRGQR